MMVVSVLMESLKLLLDALGVLGPQCIEQRPGCHENPASNFRSAVVPLVTGHCSDRCRQGKRVEPSYRNSCTHRIHSYRHDLNSDLLPTTYVISFS